MSPRDHGTIPIIGGHKPQLHKTRTHHRIDLYTVLLSSSREITTGPNADGGPFVKILRASWACPHAMKAGSCMHAGPPAHATYFLWSSLKAEDATNLGVRNRQTRCQGKLQPTCGNATLGPCRAWCNLARALCPDV